MSDGNKLFVSLFRHHRAVARYRLPIRYRSAEVGFKGCFYRAVQGEGRALVGVERGERRGDVTVHLMGRGIAVGEVDAGLQPLLRPGGAQEADGGRPGSGMGARGDFREWQFHALRFVIDAGGEVERGGGSGEVGLDALYPVLGVALRLEDERKFAYVLLHDGGEGMFGVLRDVEFRFRIEQPAGGVVYKCTRAARGFGDGGGGAGDGDMFRSVVHEEAVGARGEEVIKTVGDAGESGGVVGACRHGIAFGYRQSRADGGPVSGQRHGAVAGVRGVEDGVFHVAGGCEDEQQ